jgi:hypothetical protein
VPLSTGNNSQSWIFFVQFNAGKLPRFRINDEGGSTAQPFLNQLSHILVVRSSTFPITNDQLDLLEIGDFPNRDNVPNITFAQVAAVDV